MHRHRDSNPHCLAPLEHGFNHSSDELDCEELAEAVDFLSLLRDPLLLEEDSEVELHDCFHPARVVQRFAHHTMAQSCANIQVHQEEEITAEALPSFPCLLRLEDFDALPERLPDEDTSIASVKQLSPSPRQLSMDESSETSSSLHPNTCAFNNSSSSSFSSDDTLDEDDIGTTGRKAVRKGKKGRGTKRLRHEPPDLKRFFDVTDKDVLFGRGPSVYGHPGNVTLHNEKMAMQEVYLKMDKADKKKISQQLVDRIHELGGRFLQQDPSFGLWYEVSNGQAREKAAQVLREQFTPEMRREKRRRYRVSA